MEAFDESRETFEQAGLDDRSRKLAAQWQKYVESEMAAQAQIKIALETFAADES